MSDDLVMRLRSIAASDPILVEAADEIERLRSALLGHMQREGQGCDAYERGRRDGLEEAANIADCCDYYMAAPTEREAATMDAQQDRVVDAIRSEIDANPCRSAKP